MLEDQPERANTSTPSVSSISTRRTTRQSNNKEEDAFPDPPSPKAATASTTPQPRKKKFTILDNIFTIISIILFCTLFAQWFVITLQRWVDNLKAQGKAGWQLA